MALKVLRGTTAQRTGYTPEVGEPVWDTDTSKLYVGDGSTPGGVAVDIANNSLALDDLTDVTVSAPPVGGNGLVYDAGNSVFIPGDPTKLDDKSIDALSDVDLTTPATVGQVLKWDGAKFVPADDTSVEGTGLVTGATYPINIDGTTFGDVYSVDGGTQVVNGTTGRVVGNVYNTAEDTKIVDTSNSSLAGSLYSADRTVQVTDGSTGEVVGKINTTQPSIVDIRTKADTGLTFVADPGDASIAINSAIGGSQNSAGTISFYAFEGNYEARTPIQSGSIFGQINFGGSLTTAGGQVDDLQPAIISAKLETASDGSTYPKSAIEMAVIGGPNIPADVQRAKFDADGVFSAPILQPGTYADATARDAAITSPAAGMMVFVTDVAKFQGYDGSAWVNLN